MTPPCFNDRNVYVLGAGFSFDAGAPLMSTFMARMRDAHPWLVEQRRGREADAIAKVLKLRLDAAAANDRMSLDLDNIEVLFSLVSAQSGGKYVNALQLALGATLDFAIGTTDPGGLRVAVREEHDKPGHWEHAGQGPRRGGVKFEAFTVPRYEYYLGTLAGYFAQKPATENTFITFNYDLLVEKALERLSLPFSYGLDDVDHVRDDRTTTEFGFGQGPKVLKLHGSLNWSYPSDRNSKLHIYPDYGAVLDANGTPTVVPPTWRKDFAGGPFGSVWDASVRAIETATRIVVVGFSMPETDVHFRYLMAAGLQSNVSIRDILFVNPDVSVLEPKVYSVFRRSPVVRCAGWGVEQLVHDANERERIGRGVGSAFM